MDFGSQTVAQLRSYLNSNGVAVPQGYMKKADLVELCEGTFGGNANKARMSSSRGLAQPDAPEATSSTRKSSVARTASAKRTTTAAKRKSSVGTRTKRTASPVSRTPSPPRQARFDEDVSDIEEFRRTPSPVQQAPGSRKSFSGRPSLTPGGGSKRISIAPISTMPPRAKSFSHRPTGMASINWKHAAAVVVALVAVGLSLFYLSRPGIPRTPLCNTDGSPPAANVTCLPCPRLGTCANGHLTSCAEHFVIHGDQCVRDEAKFVNAVAMVDSISNRLISLKGQKECGDDITDTLYPEQLRLTLRNEFRHLSDNQFRAAYELAMNGEKEGIYLPKHIVTTPLGLMRSTFGRKSIGCRSREFVSEWALTFVILCAVFIYTYLKYTTYKRKRDLTRSLLHGIETNTKFENGRVQGLSVLDLRDAKMPLHQMDDKTARRTMTLLLKSYPDIQSGEEISRAGEIVYWSAHRLRAEQAAYARSQLPPRQSIADPFGSEERRQSSTFLH